MEQKIIKGLTYKTGLYILIGTLATSASFWGGIYYFNERLNNHEYRISSGETSIRALNNKVFNVPLQSAIEIQRCPVKDHVEVINSNIFLTYHKIKRNAKFNSVTQAISCY